MKYTVFTYVKDNKSVTKNVEFIYVPNAKKKVMLPDKCMYKVTDVYDEFSENPKVQLRHILLEKIIDYKPQSNDQN